MEVFVILLNGSVFHGGIVYTADLLIVCQ
uniref:Uncharacterized protein n=1 Tax=Anguilla anguilla TaxID=7936 RepID=A0A0E9PHA6_ANGAN